MATRIVEGKKPYTGGKAIEITPDKVINLRLRADDNLIIYNSEDNEIYVDLQFPGDLSPTTGGVATAFPVGITTGRVLESNGWEVTGTLISAETTSGSNIKILYGDNGSEEDGKLYVDNGTGTFKQVYLKPEIDELLRRYVNTRTFYLDPDLTSQQAIATAQEAVDWRADGKEPLISYNGKIHLLTSSSNGSLYFALPHGKVNNYVTVMINGHRVDGMSDSSQEAIQINISNNTVQNIIYAEMVSSPFVLATNVDYPTPYEPQFAGSPTTKKYVDERANTRTFYLGSLQDTTTADSAYQWYLQGNNPILKFGEEFYIVWQEIAGNLDFISIPAASLGTAAGTSSISNIHIVFNILNSHVTSLQIRATERDFISTNYQYSTAFEPTQAYHPTTKKYVDDKKVDTSATLTVNGWSSNTQTVTVNGVTASNTVIVSPAPSSIPAYTSCQVYCSAQGTDSLTFECDTTPSSAIDVNVVILN